MSRSNSVNSPVAPLTSLASKDIKLEALTTDHAKKLFPLLADPQVFQYIEDTPPASIATVTDRIRRYESRCSPDGSQRWLNWAIRRVADGQCVGFLQATIFADHTAAFAFVLGSRFWGLGLAREASLLALDALFNGFAVRRVFATTDQRNVRSLKLLARLGFVRIQPTSYPHGEVLASDEVLQLDQTGGIRRSS